jgi:hypothetical protein
MVNQIQILQKKTPYVAKYGHPKELSLTIYKEKTPIYIYAATERINKVSHKLN